MFRFTEIAPGVKHIQDAMGVCFTLIEGEQSAVLFDTVAEPIIRFYHYTEQFNTFQTEYNRYGAWLVFIAGLTPFPYKIITITSGVTHLNLWVFSIASVLARGGRFFLIAGLLYKWGEPMKHFIEKNLGWLSVLFVVLLIAGFYLIKFL